MPLVRISVRPGSPDVFCRAVADGVHRALVDTVGIPPDDRFQRIVSEEERISDRCSWAISRLEDIVITRVENGWSDGSVGNGEAQLVGGAR